MLRSFIYWLQHQFPLHLFHEGILIVAAERYPHRFAFEQQAAVLEGCYPVKGNDVGLVHTAEL